MLTDNFPVTTSNVTRFFVMFIAVLLLASGFMVHNAVQSWLTEKRYAVAGITYSLQKRINSYRFATGQIYENQTSSATAVPAGSLQETRLRPDVYFLKKNLRKTEALIFGSHDSSTLDMTQRMSAYLDLLWGAENNNWSMYFLNGQDNSLIFISTLPLKKMITQNKDTAITPLAEARRGEMLQQANALDERETFSLLRRSSWQNSHYFTMRTTFNQPGHLATVVAFDLTINDLIPPGLLLDNIQLKSDSSDTNEENKPLSGDALQNTPISLGNPDLEITSPLAATPLKVIYRIPVSQLILDTLRRLLWPLLANVLLLGIAVVGLIILRHHSLRPSENQTTELDSLRILNDEIVASLPVGLLVYDIASHRTLVSNKIAEHLLPHLNLQKIIDMSDQHQGVLQATVNNEIYEIRHIRSSISPHTQLFMMRDQDQELLITKELQKARQVLEKNHQIRQQLFSSIGNILERPLYNLKKKFQQNREFYRDDDVWRDLQEETLALHHLIEDVVLLNRLETQDWAPEESPFNLQALLDEIITEILPLTRRKGVMLLVQNHLSSGNIRCGDSRAIRKIVSSLLHYSLTTTDWGKITLDVQSVTEQPDTLLINIVDTGEGLPPDEIANADFPFLGEAAEDRFGSASGLTLFLCKQLSQQLGGHLTIHSKADIGSRYTIHLQAAAKEQQLPEEELLEGLTALIEIDVDEIRNIACHQLADWGAAWITPDERFSGQEHDILITDDPTRLNGWALLLTDDEDGYTAINSHQLRVNFNLSNAMQEAVSQLIERQLSAQDAPEENSTERQEEASLKSSEYYPLFVDTVPDDIRRLYTESASHDYDSLAQTAHRLKGVFAMLNLGQARQRCERLEQQIKERNDPNIENTISELDNYVCKLLQQGNLENE